MTPEDLTALEELEKVATQGKWKAEHPFGDWGFPYVMFVCSEDESPEQFPCGIAQCSSGGKIACFNNEKNLALCNRDAKNATFIVALRNAAPTLFAELRKAWVEIKALKKEG